MRRTLRPVALGTGSVLTGASRPAAGQPVAALAVAHAATQLVSCSSFGSAGLLFAEVALLHEKEVAGCGVTLPSQLFHWVPSSVAPALAGRLVSATEV